MKNTMSEDPPDTQPSARTRQNPAGAADCRPAGCKNRGYTRALCAAGHQGIKVDIRVAQIEQGKRIQSPGRADVSVGHGRRGGCRSASIHDCCTVGVVDRDVKISLILHKTLIFLRRTRPVTGLARVYVCPEGLYLPWRTYRALNPSGQLAVSVDAFSRHVFSGIVAPYSCRRCHSTVRRSASSLDTGCSNPSSRILLASKFVDRLNFSMRAAVMGKSMPVSFAAQSETVVTGGATLNGMCPDEGNGRCVCRACPLRL